MQEKLRGMHPFPRLFVASTNHSIRQCVNIERAVSLAVSRLIRSQRTELACGCNDVGARYHVKKMPYYAYFALAAGGSVAAGIV